MAARLLTAPAVKIAVEKLSSAIAEAEQPSFFSNNFEDMKDTMESVAAVLEDAEKQAVKSRSVLQWLDRLKEVAVEISDVVDDYQDTAKIADLFSWLTAVYKRRVLAIKIKNMRQKLEIIIIKERQDITSNTTSQDQQIYDELETVSYVQEEVILGRDTEREYITERLYSFHNKDGVTIIPICGLGGIGKTTLAQLVYNDSRSKEYYDHLVWVCVSQNFDLKKIGTLIISQLRIAGGQQNIYADMQSMQSILQYLKILLHGKKILIVLDDIWEEDDFKLKSLHDMLDYKGSMVTVIVTTRSETIANKLGTNGAYKLQPLGNDICWEIIKGYSGYNDKSNKEYLEQVGLNIAEKCGGLALAAKALGYMLRSKDLHGWVEINNNDTWNQYLGVDDSQQYNNVLPSLMLSFEQLPPMLRLCFSYCAIFQKDHDIHEDYLIHQWIALDFIKTPSQGKEYIKQLLGMSFLQHSKLYLTSRKGYRSANLMTMPALVHYLALSGDQGVILDANMRSINISSGRYALVVNLVDTPLDLSSQLIALRFHKDSKIEKVISLPVRLRVLDLSECAGQKLPDSIGQLKRLRYLNAPKIQNRVFPLFSNGLEKLRYLNLRDSPKLSALTDSFGNLTDLMYLDLSGCSGLKSLPVSFANLRGLVHLDLSRCSKLKSLPKSFANHQLLEYLDLSGCSELATLPKSLVELQKLSHLDLSGWPCVEPGIIEVLKVLTGLQYLDLSHDCGYSVEEWFHLKDLDKVLPKLTKLQFLGLQSCLDPICYTMPQKESTTYVESMINGLDQLEHLDLSRNKFLVKLPDNIVVLKELHTLDLSGCLRLESLPDGIAGLEKLHTLDLTGCPSLKSSNGQIFGASVSCTGESSAARLEAEQEITEEASN